MTSLSGYYLVKAPCCGKMYAKTAYASINMMNWERWSDGDEGGALYSNDQSVCHCECGEYFLTKDIEQVELVRLKKGKDLEADSKNAPVRPNSLPYIFKQEAFELISKGVTLPGGKIEAFIRLLVWQALNDKDRPAKSDESSEFASDFIRRLRINLIKKNEPWRTLPDDEAQAIQHENLVKLIPLLESWLPKSHFLIGNAYRALGEFGKAIDRFNNVTNEPKNIVKHLVKKAEAGYSKVVRIEPPDWMDELVMPEPWVNTKPGKDLLTLSSKWFWFKIFGMLNQVWALIEPRSDSDEVTVYWIDDNASIIDSAEFASEAAAWSELESEGYKLFEDSPDVWEIMCPPGGPYKRK